MPKILFIAAHRPGRSPSQRFRFEQYFDYLQKNGFECEFSYLISEKDDQPFYSPGHYGTKFRVLMNSVIKRLRDVRKASEFDVVFVQREAFMTGSAYFEKRFSRSGAKLVFDFDDSIWLPNVSDGNKNLEWLKRYSKTARIIELSDMVFAGNGYLAAYAEKYNSHVKIIPTTIDTVYHQRIPVENRNGKVCIGWTGTSTTLKHFELAIPAIRAINKKYGDRVSFRVIVDTPYACNDVDLEVIQWNRQTEIRDLSFIDIGIMPLPDDEWSKGKCGFKGLQYMALEIPTVMSPVGVNTEIISSGRNGFLASSTEEWVERLSQLIESPALREQVGAQARQSVIDDYSVESQKDKYLAYLREVLE